MTVVAIAACDQAAVPLAPDAEIDAKPQWTVSTLPMNIVVTDRSVSVYMEGADLEPSCKPFHFPTPDTCSIISDGFPCFETPSCLTDVGVALDGQRLLQGSSQQRSHDPWEFGLDVPFPPGKLELIIAGCGHPSTRIPLDGPSLLQVQLNAQVENKTVHLSWTTNRPATSALIGYYDGVEPGMCLVEGANEYRLEIFRFHFAYATVRPVEAPIEIVTDFGPATIWRTGTSFVRFPDANASSGGIDF